MAVSERHTSERLFAVYVALRSHFGWTHPWWPGPVVDVVLTALLMQHCDWSVANERVRRLREAGLASLPELAEASPAAVLECIQRGLSQPL